MWLIVTIQLREVEIHELKPKYKVEVTKWWNISSTALVELQKWWYITQGFWVIKGQRLYEGQESTYSGSEDLWERVLTMSQLKDSEDEGRRYISTVLRYQGEGSKRDFDQILRYIWVRLSWGIYNKSLVLYILFWERGIMSHSGVIVRESTQSWEKWVKRRVVVR